MALPLYCIECVEIYFPGMSALSNALKDYAFKERSIFGHKHSNCKLQYIVCILYSESITRYMVNYVYEDLVKLDKC